MATSTRSRLRPASAVAVVIQLCLVVASPLWHHDHHEPSPVGTLADPNARGFHVCLSGDHGLEPVGTCPICLSQRLLTHGMSEPAAEPDAPAISRIVLLFDAVATSWAPSDSILPRGPPAA